MSGAPVDAFSNRVPAALKVVDAILKGTQLPEPSEEETEALGLADYDPEMRYRVAKDVLEQHYGRPKQQVDIESTYAPGVLYLPAFLADDQPPPIKGKAGPVEELEAEIPETD